MLTGLGEWSGVDTPQTVMTTRAPAVLKTKIVLESVNKMEQLVGMSKAKFGNSLK